jgi:imidazolonepropionase-like amidohydrolase
MLALLVGGLIAAAAAQPTVVVLNDVRLIDGTGRPAVEHAALVIEEGRITRIMRAADSTRFPRGARIVQYHGRTVIPGLIDDHMHLGLVHDGRVDSANYTAAVLGEQLTRLLGYGVTTVQSLGANRDLLYAVRRDTISFPRVYTADRGVGVDGGVPPFEVGSDQVLRPRDAEEARAAVRGMAARHPDVIKIWVDDLYGRFPKMRPELYEAVIDEAHRHHLRVAAHVFYLDDAKALVRAGVDILAHSVRDKPVDGELIDAMRRRGVWYIPTLTVDESMFVWAERPDWEADRFFRSALDSGVAERLTSARVVDSVRALPKLQELKGYFQTAAHNLKIMVDSGVRVGFGTDAGAFPTRVYGFAEHHELAMMVAAGLTPMQALQCATERAAALLHDRERGTIERGRIADLVVIDGDPLADIHNTTRIVAIWHNGREVAPVVPAA